MTGYYQKQIKLFVTMDEAINVIARTHFYGDLPRAGVDLRDAMRHGEIIIYNRDRIPIDYSQFAGSVNIDDFFPYPYDETQPAAYSLKTAGYLLKREELSKIYEDLWLNTDSQTGSSTTEGENEPPDKVGSSRRQGRPSQKGYILEAYEAKKAEIDFNAPKRSAYPIIRQQIKIIAGDEYTKKGLGDETIRKIIRADFDKTKKKQTLKNMQ